MEIETVTYKVTNNQCLMLIDMAHASSIVSISMEDDTGSIVVCIAGSKADKAFALCGAVRMD